MNPDYQYGRNPLNMSLDDSMRMYEDLVQENLHLKQQIQRAKTQKYYSSPIIQQPQSPTLQSPYMQYQQPTFRVSPQYSSPLANRDTDVGYYERKIDFEMKQENEHYLEQLIEKNQYLEEKIDRLNAIHYKQNQDMQQIRNSRKWGSRFDCKEDTCYQDKYMQLLRIRSPFY